MRKMQKAESLKELDRWLVTVQHEGERRQCAFAGGKGVGWGGRCLDHEKKECVRGTRSSAAGERPENTMECTSSQRGVVILKDGQNLRVVT